jgi:hypothetical protein
MPPSVRAGVRGAGDPANQSEHKVRTRVAAAFPVSNTAWGPNGRSKHYLRVAGTPTCPVERDRSAGKRVFVITAIGFEPLDY